MKMTMCGYCCELCKAYVVNISRKDERERLSNLWHKYYDLNIPVDKIYCDGCRCDKDNAKRIDNNCPVRNCVLERGINNCGRCNEYPCATFNERIGLSFQEAKEKLGENFCQDDYDNYLLAYDNVTRLSIKKV